MDYITAAEAAEKWGVSQRQVNRLLAGDRIPGVKQYGKRFLIPADAEKPGDPRFEREKQSPEKPLSSDLAELLATTTQSMPHDNPDAILETVKEERLRGIYEGELAYLRGDFEQVISYYQNAEGDDAVKLRVCPLTIVAAIGTGNYPFYKEIEAYLKDIIKADIDANVTAIAELSLDTAYVSAIAPNMVSGWLKAGDFSALPSPLKQDAVFKRAKYFLCNAQYESALAVAQTVLAFSDSGQGISIRDVHLRLLAAVSCSVLNRTDDAKTYLLDAMKTYLPHGFITPFVESATGLKGLCEQCMEREFSDYQTAFTEQWKREIPNWLAFHNHFTKDNITSILTLREYQIAKLAAQGVSYTEIGKRFFLSGGRVKNLVDEICEKLLLSGRNRRKELAKYVL